MPANARLSAADWASIVTLYQRGEKNIRELAEAFGVSPQAIQQGLKTRNIQKNSSLDEVVSEVKDKAREKREAAVQQAEQHQASYAKWAHLLAQLTIKKITEGEQSGQLALKNADILVLGNGMKILAKAREENWKILGIEDLLGEGSELPDLNVGEYSEEELERIRDANEEGYLENLRDDDDDGEDDADLDEE